MQGLAFGALGWSSWEWKHRDLQELFAAYRYFDKEDKKEWEKVRLLGYYSVVPYARKNFRLNQVWVPTDANRILETKGTKKVLSENEVKEAYKKAGFEISEDLLKRIRSTIKNGN